MKAGNIEQRMYVDRSKPRRSTETEGMQKCVAYKQTELNAKTAPVGVRRDVGESLKQIHT